MKNLFAGIFIVFFSSLYSQVDLKLKVLTPKSNEPIEYASILIKETFEGTITDSLGNFQIKIENENQSLIIQCLGFKTDTFLVKNILHKKVIFLEVENYELSQVLVYPKNAFDIMRKAVAKIPNNYFSKTIAQNVFYRQQIVANNQLLSLEEANFDALVKFKNDNVNIATINKARAIIDIDTLKSLGKMVEKQLMDFDSIDIKRNASQFFSMNFMLQDNFGEDSKELFGEKGFAHYKYSYNGLVKKDTFYAYHITFDQIEGIRKSLYKGHFYIDTTSLAFIDIHIYLSPNGISYQKVIPKSVTFILKVLGYDIYIKGLDYNIHYEKIDDKWVLDKADTKLSAKVSKRRGASFDGYLKTVFKVNKFYLKEGFYNRKSKYDKIDSDIEDFKNENFWGNYNFINLSKKEQKLISSK